MKRTVVAIMLVLLSVSTLYAFSGSITVYDTRTDILQHIDDTFVLVGVKINLGNEGPTAKVFATVKALDSNGYKMSQAHIDGRIESRSNNSISGNVIMKKLDYLRVDKWEVSGMRAYPSH